jgi:hypothetical protein
VESRLPVPGFGPWSTKSGVIHVQPPAHILERMLAVRIHLDPTDDTNGALRVLPGTAWAAWTLSRSPPCYRAPAPLLAAYRAVVWC